MKEGRGEKREIEIKGVEGGWWRREKEETEMKEGWVGGEDRRKGKERREQIRGRETEIERHELVSLFLSSSLLLLLLLLSFSALFHLLFPFILTNHIFIIVLFCSVRYVFSRSFIFPFSFSPLIDSILISPKH